MIELEGFKMVAEKRLLEQVGGLAVDYVKTGWRQGFSITASNEGESENNCGSCSCG